jgi:hypothetical protein
MTTDPRRIRDADGEQLTFTEFVELMLARLVEADREKPGEYVDMIPLAAELKQEIPQDWVFDARNALEVRGLVDPLKVLGQTAPAKLTGEGRLFVEQGGGTGVIDEYQKHPSNFVIVSGTGHQVAVATQGDVTQTYVETGVPKEAWELLDQVEQAIGSDDTLSGGDRELALADVRAARTQLERPEPNKRAAIGLLDPLAKLATVGDFIEKLVTVLS